MKSLPFVVDLIFFSNFIVTLLFFKKIPMNYELLILIVATLNLFFFKNKKIKKIIVTLKFSLSFFKK